MEKDDEVKGVGNSYTTEFRQYDPRIGRWLSIDPLAREFTSMSSYISYANNPIFYIDTDGRKIKPGKKEDVRILGEFIYYGFVDKKGNSVSGEYLFGIFHATFHQEGAGLNEKSKMLKILSTTISWDEFENRLKKSKLSDTDEEAARAFFALLKAPEVFEMTIVNSETSANMDMSSEEISTGQKDGGYVVLFNTKSDDLAPFIETLEDPSTTPEDRQAAINEALPNIGDGGNARWQYYKNEKGFTEGSDIVEGALFINPVQKATKAKSSSTSGGGKSKSQIEINNEAIKSTILESTK